MKIVYIQPPREALARAVQTVLKSLSPAVPTISAETLTAEHTGIRYVLFELGLPGIQEPLMMCPKPDAVGWQFVCCNTFSVLAEGTTLDALAAAVTPLALFDAFVRAFGPPRAVNAVGPSAGAA